MSESLVYKFYVSLGRQLVEVEIDLIGEEYVDSLEEWANFYPEGRVDLLEQVLQNLIEIEVESGWERV